jgi:hypothetical protein
VTPFHRVIRHLRLQAEASAVTDAGDRCDVAQTCEWCGEPLDAAEGDQLRPESSCGCCRFCLELE